LQTEAYVCEKHDLTHYVTVELPGLEPAKLRPISLERNTVTMPATVIITFYGIQY